MPNLTDSLIIYANGKLSDEDALKIEALLLRYVDNNLETGSAIEIERAIDQNPALAELVANARHGKQWFERTLAPQLRPALTASASPKLLDVVESLNANNPLDSEQKSDVIPLQPNAHSTDKKWYALAASIAALLVLSGWGLFSSTFEQMEETRTVRAQLKQDVVQRLADEKTQAGQIAILEKELEKADAAAAKLRQEIDERVADQTTKTEQIAVLEDQLEQQRIFNWTIDVAEYHSLYARQSERHLVEVPARQKEHIEKWLSEQLGQPLRVPDLSDAKMEFKGARLLAIQGAPVAQLMYLDSNGEPLAFCFMQNTTGKIKAPELSTHDTLKLIDWSDEVYKYAVVGATTFATLEAAAQGLNNG